MSAIFDPTTSANRIRRDAPQSASFRLAPMHLAALACAFVASACAREPAAAVEARSAAANASHAAAQAKPSDAARAWLRDVEAIAGADADAGRRQAIRERLGAMGLSWRDEPFAMGEHRGTNVLAEVSGPADAPLLLLGAHADQVDKGEGATDNASGSATVLALAERLKQRPLQRHRVAVAFWDLEERGLLGAKAYVENGGAKPALYVNFDVFAWGDTVWMMTPDPAHALARASRETATAHGLALSAGEQYPPTDHLPFLKAGLPAVSYSLVGPGEVQGVLDAYAGKKLTAVPKVMQVIHTEGDTLAHVDAESAARGVDAVEAALRRWDADGAPAAVNAAP